MKGRKSYFKLYNLSLLRRQASQYPKYVVDLKKPVLPLSDLNCGTL